MRIGGIVLAALLATATAGAQDYLSCQFAPGWQPSGAKRQYAADNLFEYKDGGAEGYLSFGFQHLAGITCASGASTLDIDVSEMADADSAYGMFSANADAGVPIEKFGMGGQIGKQSATFAKGKFYVELAETADNPDRDDSAVMRAFAAAILKRLDGRETPPDMLGWFVPDGIVSTKMVPESVLGLRQLKRGYVARYKQGQAFLAQEESPEAAAEVMNSLRERFGTVAPAKVGDDGFEATVKYLDGICIFRKGKIIAGYANLPGAEDAEAAALKLAARVP